MVKTLSAVDSVLLAVIGFVLSILLIAGKPPPVENRLKGAELVLWAWYDRSGIQFDFGCYVAEILENDVKRLFP
ncbi:hypothetical protein D2962_09765 [Biomaibacter acetigenes]|uniref:Uncharacterized protein n=1 Tax=Biomaibacter acetigenes TaxID=2316383 RepID=A0A3G2R644_9FIRM|nr:hypothetical protein [Biomaibacter acetigenes]AYO30866.1 hypothetical protein D2962_09765 [Biomaibacter acetigenes]